MSRLRLVDRAADARRAAAPRRAAGARGNWLRFVAHGPLAGRAAIGDDPPQGGPGAGPPERSSGTGAERSSEKCGRDGEGAAPETDVKNRTALRFRDRPLWT